LQRCIEEAGRSFADNELAYLALTSKVENPIRDRVAWALQCHGGAELIVSREWKRCDLAVLNASDTGTPLAVVEFKAGIATEVDMPDKFLVWMGQDIAKRQTTELQGAALYWVALATKVSGKIPSSLRYVVKYRRTYGMGQPSYEYFDEQMRLHGDVSSGSILGGQAFGLSVCIDYWVLGPIR
jgi:hypothetical protein